MEKSLPSVERLPLSKGWSLNTYSCDEAACAAVAAISRARRIGYFMVFSFVSIECYSCSLT
jgi:hypothetical protein